MSEAFLDELQTAAQLKLGRFVVQVQRYESLVKALLIDSEVSGTAQTAKENFEKRKKDFGGQTMGTIHSELKRSYLRSTEEPESVPPDECSEEIVSVPTFRSTFRMEMSSEELAATHARMDRFKDLRNRAVHHLLDDFDLATAEGCESAIAFLDDGFEMAKAAYLEVRQWTDSVLAAREHLVAFFQSQVFEDALFHGIYPGGVVHWPASTPVRLLQRFEQGTPPGQMTSLDLALKAIQASHPGHGPRRYFCRDWQQLLVRSGLFEVRRVKGGPSEPGTTWYRSLPAE